MRIQTFKCPEDTLFLCAKPQTTMRTSLLSEGTTDYTASVIHFPITVSPNGRAHGT